MGKTDMRRYECQQCPMVATMVDTIAGRGAWSDHMVTHASVTGFRTWTWTVEELPFDRAGFEQLELF